MRFQVAQSEVYNAASSGITTIVCLAMNKQKPAVQSGAPPPPLCVLVLFAIISMVTVVSLQVATNQQKATSYFFTMNPTHLFHFATVASLVKAWLQTI